MYNLKFVRQKDKRYSNIKKTKICYRVKLSLSRILGDFILTIVIMNLLLLLSQFSTLLHHCILLLLHQVGPYPYITTFTSFLFLLFFFQIKPRPSLFTFSHHHQLPLFFTPPLFHFTINHHCEFFPLPILSLIILF